MASYFFTLNVSYDRCIKLYQASHNAVVLTSDCGRRIQIPTLNLRPFVQRDGIKGRFRLITDQNNKVKSFEKIR